MLRKFFVIIGILLNVIILYNVDSYFSYYNFLQICKKEGGVKFYKRAQKNKGWLIENNSLYDCISLFQFTEVGFCRYGNSKGEKFDVIMPDLPKSRIGEGYKLSPAEKDKAPQYLYRRSTEMVYGKGKRKQLWKYHLEIIDIGRKETVATYTNFAYHWPFYIIYEASTVDNCVSERVIEGVSTFYGGIYKEGVINDRFVD